MELIRIENKDGINFVNARELHTVIESGRDFSTWITEKIEKYGFLEGQDFSTNLGKSTGGRPSKEYHLSVNMAKELAIVENNQNGKEIRQYLIKIETSWNTPEMIMARALQLANKTIDDYRNRAISAERKNAVLMHVTKTYTASEIAKEIGMRSAQELNQSMEDCKIQYKQNGTWLPYAQYADRGFFDIKQMELDNGKVIYDRRITQIGREFLLEQFKAVE
jgi:anti-repressor protein